MTMATMMTGGRWETIGNEAAVALLNGAISSQRVSHAYLFTGPDQVGKRTLAFDFARALNCKQLDDNVSEVPCGNCSACDRIARRLFADVQLVSVSTQTSKDTNAQAAQRRVMIGIDLIIDIQADAMLEPYEGRVKIFIIEDAHRMSIEASNALLKTLEEPPRTVHLILTAPSAALLPQTIVSRCHIVRMRPVPTEVIESALQERFDNLPDASKTLAKKSMGAPGWAIAALNDQSLLDARNQSAFRIINLLRSDMPDRFDYSAEMARGFRNNRNAAIGELDRWLEILRDVAILKNDMSEYLVFEERADDLEALADAMSDDDLSCAATAVIKARDGLMVNASPQLAFDVMMLEIPAIASTATA